MSTTHTHIYIYTTRSYIVVVLLSCAAREPEAPAPKLKVIYVYRTSIRRAYKWNEKKKKPNGPPAVYKRGCKKEIIIVRARRRVCYNNILKYARNAYDINVIITIIIVPIAQLHNRNKIVLAYCWPGYRRGPQGTGFGYTACCRSKTTWKTANSQSSSAQIKYLRKWTLFIYRVRIDIIVPPLLFPRRFIPRFFFSVRYYYYRRSCCCCCYLCSFVDSVYGRLLLVVVNYDEYVPIMAYLNVLRSIAQRGCIVLNVFPRSIRKRVWTRITETRMFPS